MLRYTLLATWRPCCDQQPLSLCDMHEHVRVLLLFFLCLVQLQAHLVVVLCWRIRCALIFLS